MKDQNTVSICNISGDKVRDARLRWFGHAEEGWWVWRCQAGEKEGDDKRKNKLYLYSVTFSDLLGGFFCLPLAYHEIFNGTFGKKKPLCCYWFNGTLFAVVYSIFPIKLKHPQKSWVRQRTGGNKAFSPVLGVLLFWDDVFSQNDK